MSVQSSVGTVMAVDNAAPASYDSTGFASLSWVDVGQLSDLPSFGSEASLASHTPLKTGIVAKRRGSLNFGSVTLTLALDASDAGAAVLETLADSPAGSDAQVSVRVTLVGGAIQYYTAQVMSFKANVGNADAITMAECTLEIDNSIIKVP
tara:strand:+ start:3826 stop:4278 length:453 start_codon:yes stop_codon:yes gene_type:complete